MITFPLTVTVTCGEKACCVGEKRCPYLSVAWGLALCSVFPDRKGNETSLRWAKGEPQRCQPCLEAERKAKQAAEFNDAVQDMINGG